MKAMMIIESPNKVSTIKPFLRGKNIKVVSSIGHVRTLDVSIKNKGAVEVDNGFRMHYINNPSNSKNTKQLLEEAKSCDVIYLATDPDREGEAIAWHLKELIKAKNKSCEFRRVTYQEITEKAILSALENFGEINQDLVDAQFARQGLDFVFGFHLSPVLWKVISRGLSAGRVQSPALRLLSEREKEIKAFIPTTYWQMFVTGSKDTIDFPAKLVKLNDKPLGKLSFSSEDFSIEEVQAHKEKIDALIGKGEKLKVCNIKRNTNTRKPKPPYTTSSLQSDAVRKLGWSASRVMSTAQRLFEGAGAEHGYITYMRTDSVALSDEALQDIFAYGRENLKEFMSDAPIRYNNKSKNAQEAHEAIRPTSIFDSPEKIKNKLGADEYKLYKLIWERTVSSQMKPAVFDSTSVSFQFEKTPDYEFRSNGSILIFKGFLAVYQEGEDVDADKEDNTKLPELQTGDKVSVVDSKLSEHQTKPPARFNEATLVEELSRLGIGRPSTYVTIIKTIQDRGYARIEDKRFVVTEMGSVVSDYLTEHFGQYVDYEFTSKLNDKLDEVAEGKLNYKQVLYEFWHPFKDKLDKEVKEHVNGTGVLEHLDEICPKCGQANLKLMIGRYGKFKCCSRDKKECGYIESVSSDREAPKVFEGKVCPQCSGRLLVKKGKRGRNFLGCENYSNKENPCKYSCNADGSEKDAAMDTGVKCPSCGEHNLHIRNGRFGKMFSCSGYPKCKTIVKRDDFAELSGLSLDEVKAMLR